MNENEKNQRMLIGGVKCDQVGQIFTTLAIFFKVLGNISEDVFGILKDFVILWQILYALGIVLLFKMAI